MKDDTFTVGGVDAD